MTEITFRQLNRATVEDYSTVKRNMETEEVSHDDGAQRKQCFIIADLIFL